MEPIRDTDVTYRNIYRYVHMQVSIHAYISLLYLLKGLEMMALQ